MFPLALIIPVGAVEVIFQGVFLVVILYAVYWYLIPYGRLTKVQNRIHDESVAQIRTGYYCQRDDVVFFHSTDPPLTPEEFAALVRDAGEPELYEASFKVPLLNKMSYVKKKAEKT